MVYRKVRDEEGNYKDSQGVRYTIREAHEAWTPQGKNVGWDEFPNIEAAAQAYGLTYDPIEEEGIEQ